MLTVEGDLESETLAERALLVITEMIVQGKIPLGSPVNEAALARDLGMSRGPVREAVRRLQGRNLVSRNPYQRATVINLNTQEIREIFELREALEGMACELATRRMSHDELLSLVSMTEPEAGDSTFDLHAAIAKGSGNYRISSILTEDLYYLLSLYRRRAGDIPGRRPRAREEHWQIARAMLSRDSGLAGSLMRAHIRRAMEYSVLEAGEGNRD